MCPTFSCINWAHNIFWGFYTYSVLDCTSLTTVLKWNNLELEMGYSLSLLAFHSITVLHTETDRQKSPCLRHHHFLFFCILLLFLDNEKCLIWNSGLAVQHPAFCYSYTNAKWQDGYSLCTLTVHSGLGKMSKMFSHGWVDLITIL